MSSRFLAPPTMPSFLQATPRASFFSFIALREHAGSALAIVIAFAAAVHSVEMIGDAWRTCLAHQVERVCGTSSTTS